MKYLFFVIFLCCFIPPSFCQSKDIKSRASFHRPGQLATKYEYYYDFWSEKEIFHGKYDTWNSKGILIKSLHYQDGKKNGLETKMDKHGRPTEKIRWRSGKIHGSYQQFYASGQLKSIFLYQEGVKEGLFQVFYPNGQLKQKGTYKNNYLEGILIDYQQDGQIKKEAVYHLGKKQKLPKKPRNEK